MCYSKKRIRQSRHSTDTITLISDIIKCYFEKRIRQSQHSTDTITLISDIIKCYFEKRIRQSRHSTDTITQNIFDGSNVIQKFHFDVDQKISFISPHQVHILTNLPL